MKGRGGENTIMSANMTSLVVCNRMNVIILKKILAANYLEEPATLMFIGQIRTTLHQLKCCKVLSYNRKQE